MTAKTLPFHNNEGASPVPLQAASLDIWDKKYRLKNHAGKAVDAEIDDTYQRVARTLSDLEPQDKPKHLHRLAFLRVTSLVTVAYRTRL